METQHPTYTIVSDPKEADAVGWGFYSNDTTKPTKIYFKFPDLQPHEVRIKVHYSGLCYTEVHIVREDFNPLKNRPIVPGHEIVGEITHLGSDVNELKVGDIVGYGPKRDFCGDCKICKRGEENICKTPMKQSSTYGDTYWGGYATATQQPAKMCVKIPQGLALEKMAPMFCAGVTVFNPLSKYCKPGYTVGVNGLGGLGHLAVKFAKSLGCEVICLTRTSEKVDLCKKLGADEVVVTGEEGAYEKLKGKLDVIINTVGDVDQMLFDKLVRTMGAGGAFIHLAGSKGKVEINMLAFLMNEHKFITSYVGPKSKIEEMLAFAAEKQILPITEEYEFDDFPKAWDKLVNGKPEFRCVLKCLDGK